MSIICCNCKCTCAIGAVIASALVGIIAAFLQITGTITVTPAFLWVALGIAVVYLGVAAVTAALDRRTDACLCKCSAINVVLTGILATALLATVLLAVGVVATSLISALLVGLLLTALSLILTGTACYVKVLTGCDC